MTELLSNVFYDPSSPWYYVIGVVFLVLIFGALTAYVLLSKKFEKAKKQSKDEGENGEQAISDEVVSDKAVQPDEAGAEDEQPKPEESPDDK